MALVSINKYETCHTIYISELYGEKDLGNSYISERLHTLFYYFNN